MRNLLGMIKPRKRPRTLAVIGNAQAEVVAEILRAIPLVAKQFEVAYVSEEELDSVQYDVVCSQFSNHTVGERPRGSHARIRFPNLEFGLLWPNSAINPYNAPEPPQYPNGPFPFGDGYVVNSVSKEAPTDEVVAFCTASTWPSSWPSLDRLFQSESARLASADAACDVKIGSYITKRFASERLFRNINSPSNRLLVELATRLAQAVMTGADSSELEREGQQVLGQMSQHDALGTIDVPIHPAVAAHFKLKWHSTDMRYNYFDEAPLTAEAYFRRMIEASHKQRKKLTASEAGGAVRRAVIIYGNCQAEAIAGIVRSLPGGNCDVLYLRSFDEPGGPTASLARDDVARCSVLWEQHDDVRPFPHRDWLAADSVTVKFPAVDFNALWPFTCVNPFAHTDPPEFPYGRFPYGDRIVLDCVEREMDPEAIIAYYLNDWNDYQIDLQRLIVLEAARLRSREKRCDVPVSDFILEKFRDVRLFWTVNHPTGILLSELTKRLIIASQTGNVSFDIDRIDSLLEEQFGSADPLGVSSIPIHPKVAEGFGVAWYDAAEETFQTWGGGVYTYEEYLRAMIDDSVRARRALSQAKVAK